jgi:magnesium transporter
MPERRWRARRALAKPVKRSAAHRPVPLNVPGPALAQQQAAAGEGSVITAALYDDGERTAAPDSLAETFRQLRATPGGMALIGLYRPTPGRTPLPGRGVRPAPAGGGGRPGDAPVAKLERDGDTLFIVLRAARYLDDAEEVDFGELRLFIGPDVVITVRHGAAPDLAAVRRRMEDTPELLRRGREAVLYAILDAVVGGYAPVVAGLENDIDEIETEVFANASGVSRRIYELSREVVEFQRATRPLTKTLDGLSAGFEKYGIDEELRRYLRDVADHATHVTERVDGFRQALQDILTVNATLVGQQQNEEMKALAEASHA